MRALAHLLLPLAVRLKTRFGLLIASSRGVAAVEFAMVFPIMLVLYLGLVEITTAVNTDRKVTLLSRALADLTGRARGGVTPTSMGDVFTAAFSIMQPYSTANVKMVVSSIVVRDTGQTAGDPPAPVVQGKVCWSEARNGGAALVKDAVVTVPEGFRTPKTSFIRADVTMNYVPILGQDILKWVTNNGTASITLDQKTPWPVRNVPEVTMSGQGCLFTP